MRTLFIAAASALFFAYVITELSMRLWPGAFLPLLLLAFAALFVSGLLNLKLAGAFDNTAAPASPRQRDRNRPAQPAQRQPRRGSGNADKPQRSGDGKPARQARSEPAPADGPRESGTVKWFNRTKGFGFVIRESGEEIFVHQRSIRSIGEGEQRHRPGLKDGQGVTFVVAEREKGLQAEDVVPAEES